MAVRNDDIEDDDRPDDPNNKNNDRLVVADDGSKRVRMTVETRLLVRNMICRSNKGVVMMCSGPQWV